MSLNEHVGPIVEVSPLHGSGHSYQVNNRNRASVSWRLAHMCAGMLRVPDVSYSHVIKDVPYELPLALEERTGFFVVFDGLWLALCCRIP